MRGNGLKLCKGKVRLDFGKTSLEEHWAVARPAQGGGAVTIPAGAPERWRCDTDRRGQWAWWPQPRKLHLDTRKKMKTPFIYLSSFLLLIYGTFAGGAARSRPHGRLYVQLR